MGKRNISVVKIDLGIDIHEEILAASREISEGTKKAIEDVVQENEEKQQEKQEKIDKKLKEQEEVNSKIAQCVEKLKSANKDSPISADEIKTIMEMDSLSGIMLRLKKGLEEGLKISKRKIKKINHYWVENDG